MNSSVKISDRNEVKDVKLFDEFFKNSTFSRKDPNNNSAFLRKSISLEDLRVDKQTGGGSGDNLQNFSSAQAPNGGKNIHLSNLHTIISQHEPMPYSVGFRK